MQGGSTELTIYPNPSNGDFKIEVLSSNSSDCTIDFVSTEGTQMLRQEMSLFPGVNTLYVQAQTLNKGVYLVVVKYANSIKTERLIIY